MAKGSADEASPTRRRRRRWPWILGALLLAAALLVSGALVLLGDPGRFRGRIEQALEAATGWDAELGEIDLSLLRGLALDVHPVRLADEARKRHVDARRVLVRARLMPLLRGRLEIRRIDVVGPEIRFVRSEPEEPWGLPLPPTGDEGGASAGTGLEVSIGEIRVRDGTIRAEDRTVTPPRVLELREISLDLSPVSGSLRGRATLGEDGGRLNLESPGQGSWTVGLDRVRTEALHPLLGDEVLRAGGRLSGTIASASAGRIDGALDAAELLLLAGVRPLKQTRLVFGARAEGGILHLDTAELTSGAVRLTGEGSVAPDLDLNLDVPDTPLEPTLRFLEGVFPSPLALEPPGRTHATVRLRRAGNGAVRLGATGELSAARLELGEALPEARDVRAAFRLDPSGSLVIDVLEGTVAGGPLRGTARMDSVSPPGPLTFEGGLEEAALGELLSPLVADSARRVQGPSTARGTMTLDLGRQPLDAGALRGRLDLSAHDVTLPGWDLEAAVLGSLREKLGSLSEIAGLLGGETGRRLRELDQGGGKEPRSVLLDRLSLVVNLDRAPWSLEDFALAAGGFSAAGDGTFDADRGRIEARVVAKLDAESTARLVERQPELRPLVRKGGRLAVPVQIGGSLLDPRLEVDLGSIFSRGLSAGEREESVRGLLDRLRDEPEEVEKKKKKKRKKDR